MTQAINLIPLRIIHNDAYNHRRQLMKLVKAEWRAGKLTLWGYQRGEDWRQSKPIPYPDSLELELDWVAGPGRADGSNPRFPGLEYYCEVSAFHRNNPNAYSWTELLIASVDLDRLRSELPEAVPLASREWSNMMGHQAIGSAPNAKAVVASTVDRAGGGEIPHGADFWLTPAQAAYFLLTGENLAEVARLSEAVVVGRLARPPSASVPLSTDAGPQEQAAALKTLKEQLQVAGESPSVAATKSRDRLLAAGLAAAQGRRKPSTAYETIRPVEFCHLTLAGPHAENARGEIVFYDVRVSGGDLWKVGQAVAPEIASVELEPAKASPEPPHPVPERVDADGLVRAIPKSHSIPLIEAVHDLRVIFNTDLRSAISQMIDLMATGQLPPADALVDGIPKKIDPRWWWAGAVEYPNSAATFNLITDGESRLTHATEIRLDFGAWQRQKARIARAPQQGGNHESKTPRSVDPTNTGKKNGDTIRRRGAYRGALDAWMARQALAILQKSEPAGIAREFKAHCEQELPELISVLPKRLRSMEREIERIIERRRAKITGIRSANKGQ